MALENDCGRRGKRRRKGKRGENKVLGRAGEEREHKVLGRAGEEWENKVLGRAGKEGRSRAKSLTPHRTGSNF
ncbi:TPA: hypothetical protein ACX6Q6_003912, partial [Photobacterium damselae]